MKLWDLDCQAQGNAERDGGEIGKDRVKTEAEMSLEACSMQEAQHEALSFVSRWEKSGMTEFWIHITETEEDEIEEPELVAAEPMSAVDDESWRRPI